MIQPGKLAARKSILSFIIIGLVVTSLSLRTHAAAVEAKGWAAIAVGTIHSLGVKSDGSVWQWGNITTYRGQGPETVHSSLVPEKVPDLKDVRAVAAGQTHSLALKEDGSVWAWGGNSDYQLGNGTSVKSTKPIAIKGLTDIVSIEADWTRSYAVQSDGSIWMWGGIYLTEDGQAQSLKRPVKLSIDDVHSVSSGYAFTAFLKKDGTAWAISNRLIKLDIPKNLIQLAVGAGEAYGLTADGDVYQWSNATHVAKKMHGIENVIEIKASGGGPLMLKNDGTVWASGSNVGGQLGIGSYESSDIPVQVNVLHNISNIAAHGTGFRSMAIRADGSLWSWGNGYTGDGTEWYRTSPVGIPSYSGEIIEVDPVFVEVNGQTLRFDQPPVIRNDFVLVPLRAIFDALGANVSWNNDTRTVTAAKGADTITMVVGESIAHVNDSPVKLDAPSLIINNATLVPVRFITAALGGTVEWDGKSKTVKIEI